MPSSIPSWRVAGKRTVDPYKWMKKILSKPLLDMTEEELTKMLPSNFK
ncbi:hypothetical protein ABVC73_01740 [Prevotella melaninogenica]